MEVQDTGPSPQLIKQPLVWEEDEEVLQCRVCSVVFNVFTRRHHCRGCGNIFCNACCNNFILLPETFRHIVPTRTCGSCMKTHSSLDYSRTFDIFGHHDAPVPTIVLLPGSLGSRQTMIYTSEYLSKYFNVITMDLPGHGARAGEKLTKETVVAAVYEIINTQCPEKKAIVMGYSFGGYVAMIFSREYPEMCLGLILGGCSNECFGFGTNIYKGMDLLYSVLSNEALVNIIPKVYSEVAKERIERAFLRTQVDYTVWPQCAEVMIEPYEGFYVELLKNYTGKILFITGEKDFRYSEANFVAAAGDRGTLCVIPNGDHLVLVDERTSDVAHNAIIKWCQTLLETK